MDEQNTNLYPNGNRITARNPCSCGACEYSDSDFYGNDRTNAIIFIHIGLGVLTTPLFNGIL